MDSTVPDEKTIWYYRNELSKKKADVKLFTAFDTFLEVDGQDYQVEERLFFEYAFDVRFG